MFEIHNKLSHQNRKSNIKEIFNFNKKNKC